MIVLMSAFSHYFVPFVQGAESRLQEDKVFLGYAQVASFCCGVVWASFLDYSPCNAKVFLGGLQVPDVFA